MSMEVIEAKLDRMLAELQELRGLVESLIEARDERPDQMVNVAYVARLFNCQVSSARGGKAGTHHVRWTSRHPLRCTRAEAHRALRAYVEAKERRRGMPLRIAKA